jgi:hypothetical protein
VEFILGKPDEDAPFHSPLSDKIFSASSYNFFASKRNVFFPTVVQLYVHQVCTQSYRPFLK